jgi:FtsZ-binding cell division protein ZapB
MKDEYIFDLEIEELKEENDRLKDEIIELKGEKGLKDELSRNIDEFVEKWYEENRDLVDIGEVEICGKYKIDLIPDELEKRLYGKMIKIVLAFLARGIV